MTERANERTSDSQSRKGSSKEGKDPGSRASSLEKRRSKCLERARRLRQNEMESYRFDKNSSVSIIRLICKEGEESKADYPDDRAGNCVGAAMIVDENSGADEMRWNDDEYSEDKLVELCGGWEKYQELLIEIESELSAEALQGDSDELEAGEFYYMFNNHSPDENDLEEEEGILQCPFCEGMMQAVDDGSAPCMRCNLCNDTLPLVHPRNPHQNISVAQLSALLARALERYVHVEQNCSCRLLLLLGIT